MTSKEIDKISFHSIKQVYETYEKEFQENLKKGYKNKGRYTDVEIFANDLNNFYWYVHEYINRANKVGFNYMNTDILKKMEFYTKEFISFYEKKKKKINDKNDPIEKKNFHKNVDKIKKANEFISGYIQE